MLVRGGIYRLMRRAKATTFGAATGDSGGTSVDPGGTINTKGSYVNLGAISDPLDHVIVCLGAQRNTARSSADQFLDVASGTSIRLENHYSFQSAASDLIHPDYSQFDTPPFIPGDNLQVRLASSINDATDRLIDVVIIGFNP